MLSLILLAAAAFAQSPEPIRFTASGQEVAYLHAAGDAGAPDLVVLPAQPETAAAEFKNWSQIASIRKWTLVLPQTIAGGDAGVKMLDALVQDVRRRLQLSSAPMYLCGSGPAAPMVFYAVARAPYLWSAGLAIGGDPKLAIDTDRLFAANTSLVPVAWAVSPQEKEAYAAPYQKLLTGGFNIQRLESPTTQAALDFLAGHRYTEYPAKIDCETGNPALARCYWVVPIRFDASLRNDAVLSSRIPPDPQASLDFGGFGFKPDEPGPGVAVEWLPPDYKGPLQLHDRILMLSGTRIADPRHYRELMGHITEERPVTVTIERGKEKIRLTTHYRLRKREEVLTARVQASYFSDSREIMIVSRTVSALKIMVPPAWAPVSISWNGSQAAKPQEGGCLELSLQEPGGKPCAAFP